MAAIKDFPQDLKDSLPTYNDETLAAPKSTFSKTKKFAGVAAACYLAGTAFSYAPPISAFNFMNHGHGHGHRGPHGHHGGGLRPHHGPPHDPLEGPFYRPDQLVRSDISEDRVGVPLLLKIEVLDKETSLPVDNVSVDLWQADASGRYSGSRSCGGRRPGGPSRLESAQEQDKSSLSPVAEVGDEWPSIPVSTEDEQASDNLSQEDVTEHHAPPPSLLGDHHGPLPKDGKGHHEPRPHPPQHGGHSPKDGKEHHGPPPPPHPGHGGHRGPPPEDGERHHGPSPPPHHGGPRAPPPEDGKGHHGPPSHPPCHGGPPPKDGKGHHGPPPPPPPGHGGHRGPPPPHHGGHRGPPPPPPHHGGHRGPPSPPPHHGGPRGPPPKKGRKHNSTEPLYTPHAGTEENNHKASWLRGVQQTSHDGTVLFSTIFPAPDRHRPAHIHYKLHAPTEETFGGRFHNMDTHELTTGQLFFDDALVAKILSLAEYNRAAVQTELNDDFIFDGENLITDISYVNEDSIESGIEAKIILKIDASEYVNDEFTDSDSEAEFDQ